MGLDINLNTSKIDISEDDGLNVDLYKDNIDISDDEADDIIIEITGLKSINKFIGLEDTPLYYDNGKFFKVEDNKIVYADIQWKDISGDISESPEIVAVISDLVNEVASDIIDERINLHNLNEEAHPYIQNIIKQNYDTLDAKIDNTKEELSEALNTEIINRETADNELSENMQQETLARIEADTTLQNNINSVASDLSDEISARESADTTLSNSISDLSDGLIQEITDRQTADTGLQSQITSNYNTLDSKIDSVESSLNDLSDTVDANDTAINNKVDNINNTLTNSISTLSDTVSSNYTTLDNKIDSVNGALADSITALDNKYDNITSGLDDKIDDVDDTLTTHISDNSNPHNVTKTQVGLSNVDNTSDLDKPISTATQTALDEINNSLTSHTSNTNNPHNVTKTQIGLGNVDNTSDLNKPISTATQTALDGKVPNTRTVNNKPLSSDIVLDYSDVNALPDTTTINDLTTTAQQNALNSGIDSTLTQQITTNQNNISNLSSTVSSNYTTLDNRITSEVNTLNGLISDEETARINADNGLQSQIDAITSASDVTDIVGTYAELQAYDTTGLLDKSIIKVLQDESRNNETTYYRWVITNGTGVWVLIGEEGPYYTKSEADGRFVNQTTTVNNKALSSDITLTASDVNALPDTTVIGDGVLTLQKNGVNIDTFNANATANKSINITVPTDTADLTNGAGFITSASLPTVNNGTLDIQVNGTSVGTFTANQSGNTTANIVVPDSATWGNITGTLSNQTDLQTALNSKYDASNPDGYITSADLPTVDQVFDGTSTNAQSGIAIDDAFVQKSIGNSTIDITNSHITLTNIDTDNNMALGLEIADDGLITLTTSVLSYSNTLKIYPYFIQIVNTGENNTGAINISAMGNNLAVNGAEVATQSWVNSQGYITSSALTPYVLASSLATVATTGDYEDLINQPTIPTVGNGTITINQGGILKGTFTVNQSGNTTIDLDAGGSTPTNMVTTDTVQNISGRKTFLGEKAIYFKQTATTDKLGFTLYNPSNTELGALEWRPNTINGNALLALNCPQSGSNYVGFRYWSNINIVAPRPTTNGTYFIPVNFTDGTNTVTSDNTGIVNLTSLLPDLSGYQPLLVSGSNIKTINGASILGNGNLTLDGLPSQTGQSGKFLTTNGTDASWAETTKITIRDWSVT